MATIPQEEKLVEYIRKSTTAKYHVRNSYGYKNLQSELVYTFCGRAEWNRDVTRSTKHPERMGQICVACLRNTQHHEWAQIRDNVGYDTI